MTKVIVSFSMDGTGAFTIMIFWYFDSYNVGIMASWLILAFVIGYFQEKIAQLCEFIPNKII